MTSSSAAGQRILNLLILGELASLLYLGAIAQAAVLTGVTYVLFPELAALAYDVFVRPAGVWAKSPRMLAVTPVATACVGTLIARSMPYGVVSVALSIGCAMLVIRLLRSQVAPAISAAFLPLALGVTSWWYPTSIAFGTVGLALTSVAYRRAVASHITAVPVGDTDDEMERAPLRYAWLPIFIAFLAAVFALGAFTGLRLILFPPLVVVAFEMFAHAEVCPWAARPFALPLACTSIAAAGVGLVDVFGVGPLSVVLTLAAGIAALRLLRVHIPPALAIGLLPQVIAVSDWRFTVSVGIGTGLLVATFLAARALMPLPRPSVPAP
ncbi:MAG: HPP family protein [Burkholderiales bacterium]|nr:HPP family protein [Burkholderiales bacterium]